MILKMPDRYFGMKGDLIMQEFIPFKSEKEVISIRLDSRLLKTVDTAAENAKISRNEFINQCIVFALEHLSGNDNE